jgi:hypothetical protein
MKYTGFLCGAFSTKGTFVPEEKWKSIITSDADRQLSSNYYYPEFVDFNFGANSNSIRRFTWSVDADIPVEVGFGDNAHNVNTSVGDITLYQAPFGLTLFSVRIDLDCTGNDVPAAVSRLRNIDSIGKDNAQFAEAVLNPLMAVYRRYSPMAKEIAGTADTGCYQRLVEHGNKLKVFQISVIDECE